MQAPGSRRISKFPRVCQGEESGAPTVGEKSPTLSPFLSPAPGQGGLPEAHQEWKPVWTMPTCSLKLTKLHQQHITENTGHNLCCPPSHPLNSSTLEIIKSSPSAHAAFNSAPYFVDLDQQHSSPTGSVMEQALGGQGKPNTLAWTFPTMCSATTQESRGPSGWLPCRVCVGGAPSYTPGFPEGF